MDSTVASPGSAATAAGVDERKRDRAVPDRLDLDAIGRRIREQVLVGRFVHSNPGGGAGSGRRRHHAGLRTKDPRPRDRHHEHLSARGVDDTKAHRTAVEVDLEEMTAGLVGVIDRPQEARRRGKRRL